MKRAEIDLHIEELVLNGMDRHAAARFKAELEAELGHLLAGTPLPGAFGTSLTRDRVEARAAPGLGSAHGQTHPGAASVARAIYGSLAK